MRALVQRSLSSFVEVEGEKVGKITKGLVILVGFTYNDTIEDIKYMVDKIIHLRIFEDEKGVMNLSLEDVKGEILSISQFTLYASTEKGRRPSYIEALPSKEATSLYDVFNTLFRESGYKVETGVFGADMKVHITNDGPVTIWLESRKKNDKE